jgi:hypothetical protein
MEVAANMRAKDHEEIFQIRWNDSLFDLVQDCLWSKFSWVAALDGKPTAVIGASPRHPGAWSAFMFATDGFPKIQRDLTKFARRVIIKTLVDQGERHLQCYSLGTHKVAHNWLEWMGATSVDVPNYGKGGEDYKLFMMDLQNVHGRRRRRGGRG